MLKSGSCVFSVGPLGLFFSTTSTRIRCTLSAGGQCTLSVSGWWCALCVTLCRKGWKRIPSLLVGYSSLLLSAGSFVYQHPHLFPGAKLYSRALAMTFPCCPGPRHANLEIKGREGCEASTERGLFPPRTRKLSHALMSPTPQPHLLVQVKVPSSHKGKKRKSKDVRMPK